MKFRPHYHVKLWGFVAGAFVLAGLMFGIVWFMREPVAAPPTIDKNGVDPAIAKAIEQCTDALNAAPRSGAAWGKLGMVLLAHEYTQQARFSFEQAARFDPKNAAWPYLNGRATVRDDPMAARRLFEKAVSICGDNRESPRLRLIELLLEQQEFALAEQHLKASLAWNSSSVRARQNRARLALLTGKPQECHDVLIAIRDEVREGQEKLIARVRDQQARGETSSAQQSALLLERYKMANLGMQQEAGFLLAESLLKIGRPDEAAAERRRAQQLTDELWIDPYWDEVSRYATGISNTLARADILYGKGDLEGAERILTRAVADYPESLFARIYLGRGLIRRGKLAEDSGNIDAARQSYNQAQTHLTHALKIDPHSVEAMFRLGVAMFYQGILERDNNQKNAGMEELRKAISEKPDFTMAHFNLALMYRQQGETQAAIDSLERATTLEPESLEFRTKLVDLYLQVGNTNDARRHLQVAQQIAPKDPAVQRLLQRLTSP